LATVTKWTASDIPDQNGRTVLITGANSGLGLRSAEALAAAGARVLLACRNPEKAAVALDAVKQVASGAPPEVVSLDLADLDSVHACAKQVLADVDRLDVLMNNAGVMAIPLRRTVQGFEAQLGTNHLGHFALTGLLLPALLRADAGRVVNTSSQMHRIGSMRWDDLQWDRRYMKWPAYGQSKLANLLFTFELDRRAKLAGTSVVSVAAHPGYAATHLQAVGPEMSGSSIMSRVMDAANRVIAQPDTMGALPQLFGATSRTVRGGEYFGPDGPFESRGHPTTVKPSGAASDTTSAERLWNKSEQLTGVTFDFEG
jgi:NAD(P)-dependent dehydrogenase (short-subunit alcohol dehydrogenase family)